MTREEAISKLNELIECTVDRNMIDDICYEIIELLEAQEPRVMTLEEAADSQTPMWFEKSGDESGWITGIDCSPIQASTIGQVDGDDWYNLPTADYGRLWRCWTSRPDEKRRAETPWQQ